MAAIKQRIAEGMPMPMDERICLHCRWYESNPGRLQPDGPEYDGRCRAEPPIGVDVRGRSIWMRVDVGDWCGRFILRDSDQAEGEAPRRGL